MTSIRGMIFSSLVKRSLQLLMVSLLVKQTNQAQYSLYFENKYLQELLTQHQACPKCIWVSIKMKRITPTPKSTTCLPTMRYLH